MPCSVAGGSIVMVAALRPLEKRGIVLLEILVALAIVSVAATALVRSLAVSRTTLARIAVRSGQVRVQVRAVSSGEVPEAGGVVRGFPDGNAALSPPTGDGRVTGGSVSMPQETLRVLRFPPERGSWVVGGVAGTRQWPP